MIKHIVMYRLKDRSEDNKKALCDKFSSMKGKIDTLVDVTAGADFLGSERSFDVVQKQSRYGSVSVASLSRRRCEVLR